MSKLNALISVDGYPQMVAGPRMEMEGVSAVISSSKASLIVNVYYSICASERLSEILGRRDAPVLLL